MLFALLFALCSCTKEVVDYTSPGIVLPLSSSHYTPINVDSYNVGQIHAHYLDSFFDFYIDHNSSDISADIWNYITSIPIDLDTFISKQYYESLLDTVRLIVADSSFDIATTHLLDQEIQPYAAALFTIAESASSIAILETRMDSVLVAASNSLTEQKLDQLALLVDLSKETCKYWAPLSIGGYGNYDRLKNDLEYTKTPLAAWSWTGAAKGDMQGAAWWCATAAVELIWFNAAPGGTSVYIATFCVAAAIGTLDGGLIW